MYFCLEDVTLPTQRGKTRHEDMLYINGKNEELKRDFETSETKSSMYKE